jgi:hypothetical protein
MSSAISGGPERMLAAGDTRARFNGARLLIVQGRTTWTLPVRALRSAELTAVGAVRVTISGPAGRTGTHGLGATVDLPAPNERAARDFLDQLAAALARTEPAADGHALVRVETETRRQIQLGPRAQALVRMSYAVPPLVVFLLLIGLFSPLEAELAVQTLIVAGFLGLVGGIPLWRVVRRVRSLTLLRRRGIGVVGQVTGYVHIWDKGGHLWVFSRMTFTTVDGRRMEDIPSVVTVWGFSDGAYRGPVELSYDPEQPTRASRPPTAGFALRTLLLGVAAAVPVTGFVLLVLANLP